MSVLQVNKITKYFSDEKILDEVSFSLDQGEKAALVGVNGSGKTTVLKIIMGILDYDGGNVFISAGKTLGYSEQNLEMDLQTEVFDYVVSSFSEVLDMRHKILALEKQMQSTQGSDLEKILEQYGRITEEYEKMNGYSIEAQTRKVLAGLGFSKDEFSKKIGTLSGGERRRVSLSRLLVSQPDILLLDEPTNHLDLQAIEWLEDYLVNYQGTVLLISHDRYFLDKVSERILEISNKKINSYSGNYSKYEFLKAEKQSADKKAFEKQQKEVRNIQEFIRKYKAGVKSKQARGREKKLARKQLLEDVFHDSNIRLKFADPSHTGKEVLKVKGFKKKIHPGLIFEDVNFMITAGEAVGIIGPNGAGKTSLINALVSKSQEEGQVIWGAGVKFSYFDQHHSGLNPENTIFQEVINNFDITFEKARNMLASVLFREEDLDKKIKSLSGGEKSRVAFVKMILEEPNFLVLDEPTNHLDMESKNIMIQALADFEGTVLFISHDRLLLDLLSSRLMIIDRGRISFFDGSYEEYLETIKKEEKQQSEPEKAKIPKQNKKNSGFNPYKVKERIQELELEITELENQHQRLSEMLTEPEILKNFEKYGEVSEKLNQTDERLQNNLEEWEKLQEIFENNQGGSI